MFKPGMCLQRVNDLKDNLGNRLHSVDFIDHGQRQL